MLDEGELVLAVAELLGAVACEPNCVLDCDDVDGVDWNEDCPVAAPEVAEVDPAVELLGDCDVVVWACRPSAAANSADVPQAINLWRFFIYRSV